MKSNSQPFAFSAPSSAPSAFTIYCRRQYTQQPLTVFLCALRAFLRAVCGYQILPKGNPRSAPNRKVRKVIRKARRAILQATEPPIQLIHRN